MARGDAVTGTLLNVGTVLAGGIIGTLVGSRFPRRPRVTLMQAIGLATLAIGIQNLLLASNVLIVLASLVLGAILGEAIQIESGLDALVSLRSEVVVAPGETPSPQPSHQR